MADKWQGGKGDVLTGFSKPYGEDPDFLKVLALANFYADPKNFTPVRDRKIYLQEKAEELNEIVKKRRKK